MPATWSTTPVIRGLLLGPLTLGRLRFPPAGAAKAPPGVQGGPYAIAGGGAIAPPRPHVAGHSGLATVAVSPSASAALCLASPRARSGAWARSGGRLRPRRRLTSRWSGLCARGRGLRLLQSVGPIFPGAPQRTRRQAVAAAQLGFADRERGEAAHRHGARLQLRIAAGIDRAEHAFAQR